MSVMITVEFRIKPEKVDERLKRCVKASRQQGIFKDAKVLILILTKKTLRFFWLNFGIV